MNEFIALHKDVFSDAQMSSKLWLVDELQKTLSNKTQTPQVIWILGGWCGLTALLLFLNTKLLIKKIVVFDLDSKSIETSKNINKKWLLEGRYQAHQADCNALTFDSTFDGDLPTLIINTSCQAFSKNSWFNQVSSSPLLVIQSTDLKMPAHVSCVENILQLKQNFQLQSPLLFAGEMSFSYPDKKFNRFMLIGYKNA